MRPHCESVLKYTTSEFCLDESTFVERFTPFVDLDTVIDWLYTLASVCEKNSYIFFAKNVVDLACNLLGNIEDTSTGALTRKGRVLNMTGKVCNRLGEYNQAKEFHVKALTIRKKIFGDADVATSYNDLVIVYNSLGENSQAKKLHIFCEDHADVGESYNDLALVCSSLGEYNQAKELHVKALTIRKKIFGDADVATSYNDLVIVYNSLGENSQAKKLHEKALMIKVNFWDATFSKTRTNNTKQQQEVLTLKVQVWL